MNKEREIPPDLQGIVEFHGGFDPGILYGARLSKAAMKAMGRKKEDKDLMAIVENKRCHIDSVQCITGCTLGGKRLIVKDFGKTAILVVERESGRGVRASLKPGFPPPGFSKKLHKGLTRDEARTVAREMALDLLKYPLEDYIVIERIQITEPLPEAPFPATEITYCAKCGERVMDELVNHRDGKDFCKNCSGESYYRILESQAN